MVKARMPSLSGKGIAEVVRDMSTKEVRKNERRLIRWTVTQGTYKDYVSKIREIKIFAEAMEKDPTTLECIKLFLVGTEAAGYSSSVGNKAACAWKFLRKLKGIKKIPLADTEEIQLLLDGWEYRGDEKEQHKRGAMDSAKLQTLVEHALRKKLNMYAVGFIVIWQAMIRHGRMKRLTVGDLRLGTDVGDTIWIERRKNFNRKTMRKQTRGHFKKIKNMTEVLRKGVAGRKESEKLFPGWDSKVACELVHQCAEQYGWDASKIWDGMHCARHGANEEEKLLSSREIKAMLMRKRADWNSERSRKHYGGK